MKWWAYDVGEKMRVGIFLGYGPQTILNKEGLGRYLATLIKGLVEKGQKITVAMPKWLIESFELLSEDFQIDLKSIDFIIEYNTPVIWQIYMRRLEKRKPQRNLKRKLLMSSLSFGEFCFGILLSTTNFFVLCLLGLLAFGVGIILLPFLLVAILAYGVYILISLIKRKEKIRIGSILNKFDDIIKSVKGKEYNFYSKVFHKVLENVQDRLVRRINKKSRGIDIWYSPGIFWPCFNGIKGVKAINVPDLVIMDYPMHWYKQSGMIDTSIQCQRTIIEGMNFITYCNYVKDELLIKRYAKDEDNISVIPHMVNDMAQYVEIDAQVAAKIASTDIFTKAFCRTMIEQAKVNILQMQDYIKDFNFQNVRYIFYSSQARPHKNLMNLLKAYQYVLRKKYGEIKLFVTSDLYRDKETQDYIIENKLQYDVLCFYNVSAQQLAALYHEAELVINPTLYEGGFPFTFAEGMSVKVPSIMSDIPQVREVMGEGLAECLFNPFDYMEIADKIIWGLENKEALYEMQLPLFQKLCERNVDCYIEEYIDAFGKFIGDPL